MFRVRFFMPYFPKSALRLPLLHHLQSNLERLSYEMPTRPRRTRRYPHLGREPYYVSPLHASNEKLNRLDIFG